MKKFFKKIIKIILKYFNLEISKSKKNSNFKPKFKPEEYTSTLGIGTIIPCQIEAYFLALNKYIDNDSFNLDVGFGLGYGLNLLAIKSTKLIGVDIDEKAYDYCMKFIKGRNPKLSELLLYNGYDLNFPDNTFNVVTCVDVLEHVEDYERLLKEMLRVCQKGVFISTPNRRHEYTNFDGTPMNYYHLREWSFKELDKIVKKFGIVKWEFLNGPFEGPFKISETVSKDSITLSPFIYKK